MSLETGTTIADLNELWPLGSDQALEGDNHIRLLKQILKLQFPGEAGDGFATQILATEAELNFLVGLTSLVVDQISVLTQRPFPAGVVQLFYQSAAPTNWTQIDIDDASTHLMVRAVGQSGAGGTFGGDYDLATFDFSHLHDTTAHVLTASEIPDLDLQIRMDASSQSDSHTNTDRVARGRNDGGSWFTDPVRVQTPGGGLEHDHGDTSIFTETEFPLYANYIVCQYDG